MEKIDIFLKEFLEGQFCFLDFMNRLEVLTTGFL
jgi:hypothetical protein